MLRSLFRNKFAARRLSSWLLPAGVVLLCRVTAWSLPAEWAFYDLLMRFRPQEPPSPRVVIVGFDEDDIDRFGFPVPDRVLARLLRRIEAASPAVVGLDIFRDLPVPPGTSEFETVLREMPVVGVEKVGDDSVEPPPSLSDRYVGEIGRAHV